MAEAILEFWFYKILPTVWVLGIILAVAWNIAWRRGKIKIIFKEDLTDDSKEDS